MANATLGQRLPALLIAHPDPLTRALLYETLASEHAVLLVAADGSQAWRLLRRHHPQVALLGVALSGHSGLEVTARLKRHPLLRPTCVILLGAWSQMDALRAGIAAGADHAVTIPFSPLELLQLVEQALGLGVALGEGAQRQWWTPARPARAQPYPAEHRPTWARP